MDKKAREFDKDGEYRRKVDDVLELLKEFRTNYPFKDHPESIDDLTARDIFNEGRTTFSGGLYMNSRTWGTSVVTL